MRVLVATVVHHPEDARVLHREIRALLDAGHEVLYLAPFSATGVVPWAEVVPIDVPRAAGLHRVKAYRAARRLLRSHAPHVDVIVVHNPELVPALRGIHGPALVWDVHEDTAAAMTLKPWLPKPLRPLGARAARAAEHWAETNLHLLLAERGYQARFDRQHPLVLNSTWVPEHVPSPDSNRVVYVGSLSRARGAAELVELGALLTGVATVELVGPADSEVRPSLERAHAAGSVVWHGLLPNDQALALVEGAAAGLSLLHDEPNYRHSQPTKVIEYMAHGVPVITTPLPEAVALVEAHGCGVVVPFDDSAAAAAAVRALLADPLRRRAMAAAGHAAARAELNWGAQSVAFVRQLETWAAAR